MSWGNGAGAGVYPGVNGRECWSLQTRFPLCWRLGALDGSAHTPRAWAQQLPMSTGRMPREHGMAGPCHQQTLMGINGLSC
mmetsp:Transcript_51932/g.105642  ORF Transcript_51932/g.105642 Transcript_51932/m.105642 type:complete len:81 (+) Transcript_51932:301-543(+)